MRLKILLKYLKDEDMRSFFLYSIRNIKSLKNIKLNTQTQTVPDYLSEDIANLNYKNILENVEEISLLQNFKYDINSNKKIQKNRNIILAGENLEINYEAIDWLKLFKDPEDTSAYHRFIWAYTDVIYQLEEGNSKKELYKVIINLIESWIDKFNITQLKKCHFEIFQTYTVSERLVNWFYLLNITTTDKKLKNKKIVTSMCEQLMYICNNLEYYGEDFTGNHLLNNGKAIYIIGNSLGIKEIKEIGKKILLNEYKRIIVDKGFLREGSVHYQLLITKNYLDSYFVALKFQDYEFTEQLYPLIEELVSACEYFMVRDSKGRNRIPIIGDISPDYSPEWLITVPNLAKVLLYGEELSRDIDIGYHTPFEIEFKENRKKRKQLKVNSNDWKKIENKNWTLFSHVNNSLYPNNLTGHFHHDTGGVVVFYRGNTIITDCGRITYENSIRGNRDKSIQAHSGIYIDKKEPEINMRTIYSKDFLESYVPKKPEIRVYENKMSIEINGYTRLKGITSVIRNIEIKNNEIEIIDEFNGKGIHEVTLFFHIPFDIEILEKENKLKIKIEDRLSINFDSKVLNIRKIDNHAAIAYGKDILLSTVAISTRLSFPNKIITKLYKEV